MDILEILEKLVIENPNDLELGKKVREMYYNLKNNQDFYLIWSPKSWIAQVEGKKYYLLNLPEEQRAAEAISRILRYGTKEDIDENASSDNIDLTVEEPPIEATPAEEVPAEA